MQDRTHLSPEMPRKKVKNVDGGIFSSHKPCEEELRAQIVRLQDEVSRKDGEIEKLRLDGDVSLDLSTGRTSCHDYDGPPGYTMKMENTITHQNILIESLQESLKSENERYSKLSDEFFLNREQAMKEISSLQNEIDDMTNLLALKTKENERVQCENNEKLETTKKIKDEECGEKLKNMNEELRKKYEAELDRLKSSHEEQMDEIMQSSTLKVTFLEKQVELLSNRVSELYERDINHDTELQASRQIYEDELRELKTALESVSKRAQGGSLLPEHLNSLNTQLAESLTNEVSLKAELNSYKKELEHVKQELALANQSLKESLKCEKHYSGKINELEQNLIKLKKENYFLTDCIKKEKEDYSKLDSKYNECIDDIQRREDELVNSYQHDILTVFDALKELTGQLQSLSDNYLERVKAVASLSSQESVNSSLSEQGKEAGEKHMNHLLHLIRKSYKYVHDLNDLSNHYNSLINMNEGLSEENHLLKKEMTDLELSNRKQFQIINAQVDVLQDEVRTWSKENLQLKNQLADIQSNTVSKTEYDNLLAEKNQMQHNFKLSREEVEQLLDEMEDLKKINYEIRRRNDELIENQKHLSTSKKQEENYASLSHSHDEITNNDIKTNEPLAHTQDNCDINFETGQGIKKYKLSQFATSTPFSKNDRLDSEGGGENIFIETNDSHLSLIKWMEKCNQLEQQNVSLMREMDVLKIRIKDLEYGAQITQEEIKLFEIKKQTLESHVAHYFNLKKECDSLIESDKEKTLKIENLTQERNCLVVANDTLLKENIAIEKKYNDYMQNLNTEKSHDTQSDIITDLNAKIQEVVLLKEEVFLKQHLNKQLMHKVEALTELKNYATSKFMEVSNELNHCQMELENATKKSIEMATTIKLLEKSCEVDKMRIDYLTHILDCRSKSLSSNLIEDIQQELLNLCKQLFEEKLRINKSRMDQGLKLEVTDNLDARHQVEILIRNVSQLENEKKDLLSRLFKQQQIIRTYEERSGLDKEAIINLDKLESDLINELRSHREQYERIEEALRSTGSLHDDLQKQKDETRNKMREICSLEKKIEEHNCALRSLKMKVASLEVELQQKEELLKKSEGQKKDAEGMLLSLQKNLIQGEAKYEMELKGKDWKLREAKLKLSNAEVEKAMIRYECGDARSPINCNLEEDKALNKLRDFEEDYNNAIKQVRYYYKAQYKADAAETQEQHLEQIAMLHQRIKEQALEIQLLQNGLVDKNCSELSNRLSWQDLLKFNETFEKEINEFSLRLDEPTAQLFSGLKQKFRKFAEYKISFSLSNIKRKYEQEFHASVDTLKQLHSEEIELLKLKLEADKYNELYKMNQELIKSEKNKENSLTQFGIKDTSCTEQILQKMKLILVNYYFFNVQNFMKTWNKFYRLEFQKVSENVIKQIDKYEGEITAVASPLDQLENISQNIEHLLESQEVLVVEGKNLIAYVENQLHSMTGFLEKVVLLSHERATNCIQLLKSELGESNDILSLKEEIEQLKLEKEDLQQKHKSAIELLLSDHGAELTKTRSLLCDLKQCNENGNHSLLSKLKYELEEKHCQEMENLRIYFENKCSEIKKQYSEEIESQQQSRRSLETSSSESDLCLDVLYEKSKKFSKSWVIDPDDDCNRFDESDSVAMISMEPTVGDIEPDICCDGDSSNISLETKLHNMKNFYLKEIEDLNAGWEKKMEGLRNELESKYLTKIEKLQANLIALQKSHEFDLSMSVQNVRAIRNDVQELDEIRRQIEAAEAEKYEKLISKVCRELEEKYALQQKKLHDEYKIKLDDEVEKISSALKRQEMENVWKVQIEIEEKHREDLRDMRDKLERTLIDDLGNVISDGTMCKVNMESNFNLYKAKLQDDTLNKLRELELEVQTKFSAIQNKLETNVIRLKNLQSKLDTMSEVELINLALRSPNLISKLKSELGLKSIKELNEEIQNEVKANVAELEKLHHELEDKIKKSASDYIDLLTSKHKNEIEKLKSEHDEEIKKMNELYQNKLESLYTQSGSMMNNQHFMEKVQQKIIGDLVNQLMGVIEEEHGGGDGPKNRLPEFEALEKLLVSKYQHQLALKAQEHALEVATIKQHYDKKLKCQLQAYGVDEYCTHSSSPQTGIKALDEVIKERDCLKRMTCTLKSAVRQLAEYLITCEDELNKTVVQELLAVNQRCENSFVISELSDDEKHDSIASLEPTPLIKRVHFAPNVHDIIEQIDKNCSLYSEDDSIDVSTNFKVELGSCLEKLKFEAATLLGLSTFQKMPPVNLDEHVKELEEQKELLLRQVKELQELLRKKEQELANIYSQINYEGNNYKLKGNECTYGSPELGADVSSFLHDKARELLNSQEHISQDIIKIIDELCTEGDRLLEEVRRERDDLQQQVNAADKQLKSTRSFLEEQAAERENERDEFTREMTNLHAQLKEKEKDWTNRERFTSEVESLEQQVKETTTLLKLTQEKKDNIEEELKAAIDKVWVLRDIITELESQVSLKSEKEAELEKKLIKLESELEQQNNVQLSMVQELEALRDPGKDESYIVQIQQLQDNIKMQFNSSVVRQLKNQIRDMEKAVDVRIKELETLHITNSSNSLSSPSEEISIREQLESLRSKTPEHCPSPVALPIEEITRLQEKLQRYGRAEEVVTRQLRDQHIRFGKLNCRLEETQAQRDAFQQQSEKLMNQLAVANNKIDDLRRKADSTQTSVNRNIVQRVKELEEKLNDTERSYKATCDKLNDTENQLQRAEAMLEEQRLEIKNLLKEDYEAVDSLRLELASVISERNKLQALVDKYKRELHSSEMPALMEVILADKNEDIDHLQKTVALLRSQVPTDHFEEERSGNLNSKGHRVSFAADLSVSCTSDDMRLRDAPKDQSLEYNIGHFSEELEDTSCVLKNLDEFYPDPNISELHISRDSSASNTEKLIKELNDLKEELAVNKEKTGILEKELQILQSLDADLNKTKKELEDTVALVMEDKKYYEEQFHLMGEQQKVKDEELLMLRDLLAKKDEDIIRTTGDVRALQIILDNLQQKLEEAKIMAEREHDCANKEELNQLREENELLKQKEQKLNEALVDLTVVKRELEKEKNVCSNIKMNILALEHERETLSSELDNFEKTNSSLVNKLQETEINLQHYTTLCDNLQKELLLNKDQFEKEAKKFSDNLQNAVKKGSCDISNLCEEIIILKSANEKLITEKNDVEMELNQVKLQLSELREQLNKQNHVLSLENKISNLNGLIKALRDKGARDTIKFMTDINEMQKDIALFKAAEIEVKEKLNAELNEKRQLQEKIDVYDRELAAEKNLRQITEEKYRKLSTRKSLSVSDQKKSLSFSGTNVCEIVPTDPRIVGLEDLAVQVRKELNLSAQLDKTLLGFREPSPEPTPLCEFNRPNECRLQACGSLKKDLSAKVHYLEQVLAEERAALGDLKKQLAEEELHLQTLSSKKSDLEGQLDKLLKVVSYQEERITQLSVQLDEEKNKALTFELNIIGEKTKLKQLQAVLEDERHKAKTLQREDTQLIETLRIKLECALDSEAKLRGLLMETNVRMQSLEAQINSARAMEQYNSDTENEHNKQLRKLLFEEKEKYVALSVEVERLRRTSNDYEDALAQERKTLDIYKEKCHQIEQQRRVLENELDELRQKLKLEIQKCEIMKGKVRAVEETEMRRSKSKSAMQARHRQALEKANQAIRELEQECKELRGHLKIQQEHDEKWRDDIHIPLLQQLNEVNLNLEVLVKERSQLRNLIEQLKTENYALKVRVNSLQENIPERLPAPSVDDRLAFLELPSENSQLCAKRYRENYQDLYIKYLRAESFRKALIWQKRYLLVALHGYQDSESYLMHRLGHRDVRFQYKSKFKCVALVVLAIVKIMYLVNQRKIKYQKNIGHHKILHLPESLDPRPLEPLVMQLSHSPPSRDTAVLHKHPTREEQLSPSTIVEYLKKFNEMQRRLGKTLEQADL